MKNLFYLLICFSIFMASCSAPSSPGIPYKPVTRDTAKLMILKYLTPGATTADTSFREVPKKLDIDVKTLKTFTADSKDGKVKVVKFILSAYLESNIQIGLKNTILLQVVRVKDEKEVLYYYDLRKNWDPVTNRLVPHIEGGSNTVCPLPADCVPSDI
jgi:hypothetical protein